MLARKMAFWSVTSTSSTPRISSHRSRSSPTDAPGMQRWRKKPSMAIARTRASPIEAFGPPVERTATMGS